jgi:hypothetical protein
MERVQQHRQTSKRERDRPRERKRERKRERGKWDSLNAIPRELLRHSEIDGSAFHEIAKRKSFPSFVRSFHATKRNLPPFIFFVGNPHLPPRIPLCSMIAHTLINIFFHIVYCLSLSLSLSFFHNSHTQMYLPITHSFSIFLFLSFCLSVCHSHTQFLAFFFPFLSICTQYSLVCVLSILYFLAFCAGDH